MAFIYFVLRMKHNTLDEVSWCPRQILDISGTYFGMWNMDRLSGVRTRKGCF
jgi:hypothetical protein